jgi:aconitate hydratase
LYLEQSPQASPDDGSKLSVHVSPTSQRLALLEPFDAWNGKDLVDMPVLIKAKVRITIAYVGAV